MGIDAAAASGRTKEEGGEGIGRRELVSLARCVCVCVCGGQREREGERCVGAGIGRG